MINPTLTKSLYVTGVFCPKLFWTKLNRPKSLPEAGIDAQARMNEGQEVGKLATQLWPGGVSVEDWDKDICVAKTNAARSVPPEERIPLYEAGFKATIEGTNCYARVDVLVPVGKDSWNLFEVKSGSSVKDEHKHDVAFQIKVLEANGINIHQSHIVHINSDYIRGEHIDVKEFLTIADMTDLIATELDDAEHFIPFLNELAAKEQAPETICEGPKDCDACSKLLPPHSVFELAGIRKKKAKAIWSTGHKLIENLPRETKLSRKQAIQSVAVMTNQPHIHREPIKEFIETITYPIYHLDFETFNTGIPKYKGTKPYQQIVFQYSLHIEEPTGELKHVEFLAEPELDPRPAFLASLKAALSNTSGTILVFNAGFEVPRMKELMRDFPEHEQWLTEAISKVKDLAEPFKSFAYYHPDQHGKYSIKSILPVLTPTSYDGLDIAGGGVASASFLALENASETDAKDIRTALLAYCKQDTQSMIDVLKALKEL